MKAAVPPTPTPPNATLGAATEALIMRSYADTALLSSRALASVLGVDEKTLRTMREAGTIRAVIVGSGTYRYAEIDVREYLAARQPTAPKPTATEKATFRRSKGKRPPSAGLSFTEELAKRRRDLPRS